MSYNKAIIIGRLTKDPEAGNAQGGKNYARFTVAVDRPAQKDKEKQTDFISCVAWGKTAEFICRYFGKGSAILVEGTIRTGSYEKSGVKHYTTDIMVQNVTFVESKKNAEQPAQDVPQFGAVPNPYAQKPDKSNDRLESLDGFEKILSDGDVPF